MEEYYSACKFGSVAGLVIFSEPRRFDYLCEALNVLGEKDWIV
jgi:hypothetical protein